MSDDFIMQVERRLGELRRDDKQLLAQEEGVRRRRIVLRDEMQELQASLKIYRQFMGMPAEAQPESGMGLFDDVPMGTIADMAMAVIKKHGEPMKVAEITRALEQVGKLKPETDGGHGNYGTVYGTLKRDRRFSLMEAGRFGLASMNGSTAPEPHVWQSHDAARD